MKEEELTKEFREQMMQKILNRRNRYAEMGWKTMDIKRMVWLLEGELSELKEAMGGDQKEKVKDEAIDIANYAMFIYAMSK